MYIKVKEQEKPLWLICTKYWQSMMKKFNFDVIEASRSADQNYLSAALLNPLSAVGELKTILTSFLLDVMLGPVNGFGHPQKSSARSTPKS